MSDSGNRFYKLTYPHEEIQAMFDRIANGWFLTRQEYDELMSDIGLGNISTFSGSYKDLKDVPDFETLINTLINKNNIEFAKLIEEYIANQDSLLAQGLEDRIVGVENTIEDEYISKEDANDRFDNKSNIDHTHDDLYISKEYEHYHENQNLLNNITQETVDSWSKLDNISYENIDSWNQVIFDLLSHQIYSQETYTTKDSMIEELNKKSNVDHDHDTSYGSKELEHTHENKEAIDLINEDKIKTWDDSINVLVEALARLNLVESNKVNKEEGYDLSQNNFNDIYKNIMDEIIGEDEVPRTAAEFIGYMILDSATGNGAVGEILDSKAHVNHKHDDYVIKEQYVVKLDDGNYEIINAGEIPNENQITADDKLVSSLIESNILQIGDKINIQNKVLSEASVTLKEKEYLSLMTENGNNIINDIIQSNVTDGLLNIELDKKVDKIEGYSLVQNEQIDKLLNMELITEETINQAFLDVFK